MVSLKWTITHNYTHEIIYRILVKNVIRTYLSNVKRIASNLSSIYIALYIKRTSWGRHDNVKPIIF
jgi:hypothetical protein